jgi:hypothetical protein
MIQNRPGTRFAPGLLAAVIAVKEGRAANDIEAKAGIYGTPAEEEGGSPAEHLLPTCCPLARASGPALLIPRPETHLDPGGRWLLGEAARDAQHGGLRYPETPAHTCQATAVAGMTLSLKGAVVAAKPVDVTARC